VTTEDDDKRKDPPEHQKESEIEHQAGLPGRILKGPDALEGFHRVCVCLEPIVVRLNPSELLYELVPVGLTVPPVVGVLHLREHLVQHGRNLLIDRLDLWEKRLDLSRIRSGLVGQRRILRPKRGVVRG
jgi:hypothetical protein